MNIQDQKNRGVNPAGPNGASKSIFNASYKELKPSKSVDLTSFNGQAVTSSGHQYDESLFNQLTMTLNMGEASPANQLILREKERIVQIACGSIHTLARSNIHRLFSCGNGSTFALGHKNRDSCSTFKQVEFFNGLDSELGVTGVGFKTIACGLSHSGCVLSDGSVYLWGITGDIQVSKEFMEKCLVRKPTKVTFRGGPSDSGSLSHRRRSGVPSDDSSSVILIEDLKLGEQFSMALTTKGQVFTWG